MKPRILSLIVLIAFGLVCMTGALAQDFKIGQPAPELKVGKWHKGPRIAKFEPGRIYVMEFWATWCGPCRAAMPHLSELARKYKDKVTIIGMNVFERGEFAKIEEQVSRFVRDSGKDMDYPVCSDTRDEYLKKNWFSPTGSLGIPATVVVDGKGQIAWIGGTGSELENTLKALIAGKFDYQASAKRADRSRDSSDLRKVIQEYSEAMAAKDWARAIKIIDSNPQQATFFALPRFAALVHLNPTEAFTQLKAAVATKDKSAPNMFTVIGCQDGLATEVYRYVIEQLGAEPQAMHFEALAFSYFKTGNRAKAIEIQEKLVAFGKEKKVPPTYMDKWEEALRKYRG
jgi:thiol-disulfide isomerase/thioredoxin